MTPSIDTVIVNWNSGDHLRNCLASFSRAIPSQARLNRVVVVDNASSDHSLAKLSVVGAQLDMISNDRNVGFGAACNQGALGSTSDYILFLNPDTELLPGSLETPVVWMEQPANRAFGICGVQLCKIDGSVSRTCARFVTLRTLLLEMIGLPRLFPARISGHFMTDWDHESNRAVDQVMGAFLLIRRNIFQELGGFDERFFVYMEDMDLALRAHQLGAPSFFLAEASIIHVGGASSSSVKALRLFYGLRSRILYAFKHFSFPIALVYLGAAFLIEPITRLSMVLIRGTETGAADVFAAYGRLLGWLLFRWDRKGRT